MEKERLIFADFKGLFQVISIFPDIRKKTEENPGYM